MFYGVQETKNSVGVCGWWLKVAGVKGKPTHTFSCCQAACQVRMVHTHLQRLRIMLRSSRVKCAEAEAKLAEAVADGNAKLTESEHRFHASDAKRRDAELKPN